MPHIQSPAGRLANRTAVVNFIFMTGTAEQEAAQASPTMGAEAVLGKPFEMAEMRARIKESLAIPAG